MVMEIKGEAIDVTSQWPAADVTTPPEVTPENWKATVWEPLVAHILSNFAKGGCYVCVEVCYTNSEGNFISAPAFFKWCPDTGVPVKTKMMLGSSFQSVKRKLDVQGTTPELSQASELDINKFAAAAKLAKWVNLE